MKIGSRVFVMSLLTALLFVQAFSVAPAVRAQAPSITASLSGPSEVAAGGIASLILSITNLGDSAAYCVTINIDQPPDFNVSLATFGVGEVDANTVEQLTINAVTYSHNVTDYFGGAMTYFDGQDCGGDPHTTQISGLSITEVGLNTVTFILLSNQGWLPSATVSIIDFAGNVVTTFSGASDCPPCTINATLSLPSGQFQALAIGMVQTQDGTEPVAGQTLFSSNQTQVVTIDLEPFVVFVA